jgi:acetolactate synthase I/II/III large subunit
MEYNGAELVVEILKTAGVRHLFGVAGTDVLPIMDVLYGEPEIRYLQAQHEQGAMFMANGYARTSRQVGISVVSPGPGASNSLTGVAQAFYTSTPSILICIEEGTRHTGLGPSQHHDLDTLKVFSPVTKWAGRVSRIDRLVEGIHTAIRVALSGRKGPCYLGIHRDILDQKIQLERVRSPFPLPQPPRGNSQDIEGLARLLTTAQRPLILAGGGVYWSQAQQELLELAELWSAPIATTTGHKGIIPEDHPLALGAVGISTAPPAFQSFEESDLLLAIGCSFTYFSAFPDSPHFLATPGKIAHVDIDPTEIGKVYPTESAVVGDAKLVVRDLIQAMQDSGYKPKSRGESPWLRRVQETKDSWQKRVAHLQSSSQVPIRTWRLLTDLRKALPRDAVVSGESGGTYLWVEYGFQAFMPNTIGGWHPLGAEISEAQGAKVALPNSPVVSITGDGSMMMGLSEIATASAYKIPVLYVVRHNGVFGNMRQTQIEKFGSRFLGTGLPIPNLANVAKELGARGERITEPDQIIPAVERFLESGEPTVLDVICDETADELVPPL